jgi:hypothetical protein
MAEVCPIGHGAWVDDGCLGELRPGDAADGDPAAYLGRRSWHHDTL